MMRCVSVLAEEWLQEGDWMGGNSTVMYYICDCMTVICSQSRICKLGCTGCQKGIFKKRMRDCMEKDVCRAWGLMRGAVGMGWQVGCVTWAT